MIATRSQIHSGPKALTRRHREILPLVARHVRPDGVINIEGARVELGISRDGLLRLLYQIQRIGHPLPGVIDLKAAPKGRTDEERARIEARKAHRPTGSAVPSLSPEHLAYCRLARGSYHHDPADERYEGVAVALGDWRAFVGPPAWLAVADKTREAVADSLKRWRAAYRATKDLHRAGVKRALQQGAA